MNNLNKELTEQEPPIICKACLLPIEDYKSSNILYHLLCKKKVTNERERERRRRLKDNPLFKKRKAKAQRKYYNRPEIKARIKKANQEYYKNNKEKWGRQDVLITMEVL